MGKNKYALITGVFLIVLTAATAVVVYWIGHFERERNVYYVSTRQSVTGLNPESTVFYRGIAVGKVLDIHFDPNDSGAILVPIEVDKEIVLSKGVFATLQLKGVTGLTQIQLEDPEHPGGPLPPGSDPADRIPLQPSLADRLMNTGEDILKKAEHIMVRLSVFLSDENEKNVTDILNNLKSLSNKLNQLEKGVDKALAEVPKLGNRAGKTLDNIDRLANDLQSLSKDVRALEQKAERLAETGFEVSDQVTQTTLPKVNELMSELQSAAQQVNKIANLLENNPQSLIFGLPDQEPAPGEPGYKEPR
ncbi:MULTISPECIES: MlaD family protein [Methylomicrobium]|uniref:ABC-type transport system involved in resistance to organic solvents, periplasmic component n=1 Tax=Methylomicrobium album BG8 TaxID=686340 RepID=H8GMG8_METAL|nr:MULTISPECIES: MlaD family protein [Methylomicrobium]EIC30692.1 ABC-type transport system involved in resistance to organic solvents, periplasmic component [Methylomicrobium album BG8]